MDDIGNWRNVIERMMFLRNLKCDTSLNVVQNSVVLKGQRAMIAPRTDNFCWKLVDSNAESRTEPKEGC